MPDPSDPKNVESMPAEERALQLTTQINEIQTKLNAKDMTEQTAEELDEVTELYKQIEALYRPEGKEYRKGDIVQGKVSLITNNGIWINLPDTTMRAACFPEKNDPVRYWSNDQVYYFEVIGTEEYDYANGENIILLKFLRDGVNLRQTEFTDIGGERVTVDEELEKFGLKVGQKIKVKDSVKAKMDPEPRDAKELTVVGFDKNDEGCIIIQLDGGPVTYTYYPDHFNTCYETAEEPRNFYIELAGFNADQINSVIQTIIDITGFDLPRAKKIAEDSRMAPKVICDGLTKEQADTIYKQFEKIGARIVVGEEFDIG